ncbi:interleukin-27 subunit beta [Caretta caretta]|uniref:interleukin-27 subunit beta n=1 Tax=Caretta caretta TaxID=8467 RepID=UPI00209551A5|nr:interleukin-27 subunit beta [Caretta caretta]
MKWMVIVALVLPAWSAPCSSTAGSEGEEGLCHVHHGALGTDLILHCDRPVGAARAEWRVNGTKVAMSEDAAGGDKDQLLLRNASLAQEGEYSCHHPGTGKTLSRIRLRVGSPPEKPAIECWAVSYPETVNCTWKLKSEPRLETYFITTYRHGLGAKENKCVQPGAGASSCSISDIQMFSITPYVLNVTAVNPLGATMNLFPFIVEQIIRPDPPEDLRVSPIPGESKKLLLEWQPPSSWPFPQYFPLKYLIRYARAGANNNRTIGPYEQTSFILTGIRPRTIHHVQVAARDFTDYGDYSTWSPLVSGTPWTQP